MIDPRDAACAVFAVCSAASFAAAAWHKRGLKNELRQQRVSVDITKEYLNVTIKTVIDERKRSDGFQRQIRDLSARIEALESSGA